MGRGSLKPSRGADKLQDAYNRGFKQGKFEERERIFKEIEEHYGAPAGHPQAKDWGIAICAQDWQALREEK